MAKNIFKNTKILITGGTGSWGNELVAKLLVLNPKEIRIYSRGEHKQVEMKYNFNNDPRLKFIIGDVRDKNQLLVATQNVDFIFHLAALKHVPVCEENPWEAVQTNIIGTQNVIEAAIEHKVKKVIEVSSDKAVDPLNIYGTTKACAEKIVIAANLRTDTTKFVCVRSGNVLSTNGSVIPLFTQQIKNKNEITLTDESMTRFFIRQTDVIHLVLEAAELSVGGEIFVTKMPAARITRLAEVMIKRLGNRDTTIKHIGIRAGEKIHEVLISKYEVPRTYEYGNYFVILPMINLGKTTLYYKKMSLYHFDSEEYNSNNTHVMTFSEIEEMLESDGWLPISKRKKIVKQIKEKKKSMFNFFKSNGHSPHVLQNHS